MLNISPFSFGLIIQQVFDNGSIYSPEVLDITEDTLHSRFLEGVRNVASVCLQIVPHSIINGYKRVLALSVETDYTFPLAEKVKAFLADPSARRLLPLWPATTAASAAAAVPAKGSPPQWPRTIKSGGAGCLSAPASGLSEASAEPEASERLVHQRTGTQLHREKRKRIFALLTLFQCLLLENLNYGCWYLKWSENGAAELVTVYSGTETRGDTNRPQSCLFPLRERLFPLQPCLPTLPKGPERPGVGQNACVIAMGTKQGQEVTRQSGEGNATNTPLLLSLPAVQALASPGYLSLRWPWTARQPPSKTCLCLGPALGGWGAEGTLEAGVRSGRTCLGAGQAMLHACHPASMGASGNRSMPPGATLLLREA
ncbi:hypothetical protein QTO34_013839 [Cnephaeus nilssonii]|uniref:Large ribosomal subunit protein uL10 n=1 Tax=Cnephaeus nilssonii TaxID=3371016 RepID=A0AA40I906_CNENI|nr:hypothetical protein QTO34_013839 [Eptesicus nilssonii]